MPLPPYIAGKRPTDDADRADYQTIFAREDGAVREALAGGPIEGALLRVAATGALERSREVALDYAREARASLNGELHREQLESLADAVVNRKR